MCYNIYTVDALVKELIKLIEELYNYIDNVFVYSKDIDSKILESEKSKLKIYIKNNIENLSDLSFDTLTKEIDKKLTYLLDK